MRFTKQSSCPAPSVSRQSGGGSVTGNESFVTVNDDSATLPNSRQITQGSGITIVDSGAGNPITINGKTMVRNADFIQANNFMPAQSPLSPAPIIWTGYTDGFAVKAIKLVPGAQTEATLFHYLPRTVFIGEQLSTGIAWASDNADANAMDLRIGLAFITTISPLNSAMTYYPFTNNTSTGVDRLGYSYYDHTIVAGQEYPTIKISIRRGVDSHPGNCYVFGLLLAQWIPLV